MSTRMDGRDPDADGPAGLAFRWAEAEAATGGLDPTGTLASPIQPVEDGSGPGGKSVVQRRVEGTEALEGRTRGMAQAPVLDGLTALATRVLQVPAALVSLVGVDRQLLLSVTGLRCCWALAGETPVKHSLCRHVVEGRARLVIGDVRRDPVAATNPLVESAGIGAYAGSPIWSPSGRCLGAFAVLAFGPRRWSSAELEILDDLATTAALEIARALDGRPAPRSLAAAPANGTAPGSASWAAARRDSHGRRRNGSSGPSSRSVKPVVGGSNPVLRFWHRLKYRRVVRVAAVYLGVTWLAVDVASELIPALHLPETVLTALVLIAGVGLPVVMAAAWAFDLTPRGLMWGGEDPGDDPSATGSGHGDRPPHDRSEPLD